MKKPPLKSLLSRYFAVAILLSATFVQGYQAPQVGAAPITTRSLTLQTGAAGYGGSTPAQDVNHTFTFTAPSSSNVQSILFEYCDEAADPDPLPPEDCNPPTGLDAGTGVTLSAPAGWSLVAANGATAPYITRTGGADITGGVTATLLAVRNPTATNTTFFVRIKTFASADTTGSAVDSGTVAASTATPIVVKGTMPESLVFCTGENIDMLPASVVPDCASATDGEIYFDQLFSPQYTTKAQSEMAASTNAGAGYVITVTGPTLMTGSTPIAAMGNPGTETPAAPALGVAQFGINLVDNGAFGPPYPDVGASVTSPANGTNFKGQPATGYDTVDAYLFDPAGGDIVANSFNGGAGGSDGQIFTISYIVNVPGSQPAGNYETTLTYICTPTF